MRLREKEWKTFWPQQQGVKSLLGVLTSRLYVPGLVPSNYGHFLFKRANEMSGDERPGILKCEIQDCLINTVRQGQEIIRAVPSGCAM